MKKPAALLPIVNMQAGDRSTIVHKTTDAATRFIVQVAKSQIY